MRLSFIGWTPTQGWDSKPDDIISSFAGLQSAPTKPGQVCPAHRDYSVPTMQVTTPPSTFVMC